MKGLRGDTGPPAASLSRLRPEKTLRAPRTAAAALANAPAGEERWIVHSETACKADAIIRRENRKGGASRGAFCWGVVEEERIEIDEVSATRAAPINATVLAYGFATGGRDGTRGARDVSVDFETPGLPGK
jgi:hypothetical protein